MGSAQGWQELGFDHNPLDPCYGVQIGLHLFPGEQISNVRVVESYWWPHEEANLPGEKNSIFRLKDAGHNRVELIWDR